jgi:L-aspartate oxidase
MTMQLPRRLVAAEPGWFAQADVIVVGSGIAGLTTALEAREAGRVLLVTKTFLDEGSTVWAQGGIAAALAPEDSPEQHLRDTLVAGVGLCDEQAVRVLVTEGPARVHELVALGTRFERTPEGAIALTREGGHLQHRIAHAGGDATGREISRALLEALDAVRTDPRIEVIEHALVVDLLHGADRRVCGVTLHVIGEGQRDGVGAVLGRAVVLATGGLGQVYLSTTNPSVSTGDGVAAALRAGADVADLEFVQFHPTVLWLGRGSTGQQPLVSEAVRGEGAYVLGTEGRRFMVGAHPLAELAPRDVVTRAVVQAMAETGSDHVWLDARHLGEEFLETRFPSIVARCRAYGIDPATQLVPVAPAQHYASGGIRTDLHGRTSLPGLYACGEVSWTGVHGANRLASNSLLEGLVFGHRIAQDLAGGGLGPQLEPVRTDTRGGLVPASARLDLQAAMTAGAGVLRSAESLGSTLKALDEIGARQADGVPTTEDWETTNLHTVGSVLTQLATLREETRGGHWREDHPERDDEKFLGHFTVKLDADGDVRTKFQRKGGG